VSGRRTRTVSRLYVLDASAILCLLQSEPGANHVAEALPDACIGAVNYSEMVGKLIEGGMTEAAIDSAMEALQLEVIAFDRHQARLAGLLRGKTRRSGLSLGDRTCLTLAGARYGVALTCDRSWKEVEAGCEVELVR